MTPFQLRVIETQRKRLRAVQDKLPVAIADKDLPRILGLAQASEQIANTLLILLDQVKPRA